MIVEPTGADRSGSAPYALSMSEGERMRYRRMAQGGAEREAALWARAGFVAGARVADIGCGPGAMLRVLAGMVGPGGRADGVEPDPQARTAAEEEIADLPQARVVAGDGVASGLDPASYDAVMMRHVLFHTGDLAPAIVAHSAELLRPGGHLYLVDVDATAIRLEPPDPDALDQLHAYREFQRGRGNDVGIGPRLGHLLLAAGLELVEREAHYHILTSAQFAGGGPAAAARPQMIAAGVAPPDAIARWDKATERLRSSRDAVMFMPQFIAVGRRTA